MDKGVTTITLSNYNWSLGEAKNKSDTIWNYTIPCLLSFTNIFILINSSSEASCIVIENIYLFIYLLIYLQILFIFIY